ncbi:MAG: hypothetical protein AAGA48_03325 [Myxococcota bacterium]
MFVRYARSMTPPHWLVPRPTGVTWFAAGDLETLRADFRRHVPGPPDERDEPDISTVFIHRLGPRPWRVLHRIRDALGLSLAEAKRQLAELPLAVVGHHRLADDLESDGAHLVRGLGRGNGEFEWPVMAEDLMRAAPHLRWNERFDLRAVAWRRSGDGHGRLFPVPIAQPLTWQDLTDELDPVHKAWLVPSADEPRSYLEAAIVAREATDFAALWHGVSWGHHHYIDALPASWSGPAPSPIDWRPRVEMGPDTVSVVFCTQSGHVRERLVAHRDTFTKGSASLSESEQHVLAEGPGGYVC